MRQVTGCFLIFIMLTGYAYAQHAGRLGLCHINGKVEYSTDSKNWESIRNMCKIMGEQETLSIGPASSVGVTYKEKYLILDKSRTYTYKELVLLMENKQSFNDYLNPKQEFIIRNFMEYYRDPDLYFTASNLNLRGSATQSTMIFPADSELVLNNTNLFVWSRGDKPTYHLIILEDFQKGPVFELNTTDTFARVDYKFIKDRIYYWCVNYQQNTVGFFSTFKIAGDKKTADINRELSRISTIPKIDEVNRIMISAIVYEDNKCFSEAERILRKGMQENKYNDLKLYYGLYLKRRGYHDLARQYLN